MKSIIKLSSGENIELDGEKEYFSYDEKRSGIRIYKNEGNIQIFYPFTSILSVEENYSDKDEPIFGIV